MRRFVVAGHRASTTADFKLDDLAGGGGRMDVMARCVGASMLLSHGVRRDAEAYLVLEGGEDPPKTVVFDGAEVKYLNPDERSVASLIRNALLKPLGDSDVKASPGVTVSRRSFPEVIDDLARKGSIVYLREDGEDIRACDLPDDPVFVMGDDRDLTGEEEAALEAHSPMRVSLGPASLHANHCIVVVQNELDRREAADARTTG